MTPGDVIGDRSEFRQVRSLTDLAPGDVVGADARCRQYVVLAGALIVAEVLRVEADHAVLDMGGPRLVVHRTHILRRI